MKGTPIFDLELGYEFSQWATFSVGANNLFNKVPEIPAVLQASNLVSGVVPTNGTSPYVNGTTTINGPYTHGPYGANGGYYYARLTFKF